MNYQGKFPGQRDFFWNRATFHLKDPAISAAVPPVTVPSKLACSDIPPPQPLASVSAALRDHESFYPEENDLDSRRNRRLERSSTHNVRLSLKIGNAIANCAPARSRRKVAFRPLDWIGYYGAAGD